MTMKSRPGSRHVIDYAWIHDRYVYGNPNNPWAGDYKVQGSYWTGPETITYDDYPRLPNGHWPWKECLHESALTNSGPSGSVTGLDNRDRYWQKSTSYFYVSTNENSHPYYSRPPLTFDPEALAKCYDQLDLNTRESTLLYSGILQAVPLVGGAFRFVSIMNRAARRFSKSFRKKPFTTVVKAAISGDFIDRFVVSPTIDDARRFLDASNYVVRVMNTAYERNAAPVALQGESGQTLYSSSGSGTGYGNPWPTYDVKRKASVSTKAYLLLEAHYDTNAISPIKLWADRCGVTRPLDSVWDLVPFSFVIDYFTRAGDFISGLSDRMASQEGLKGRIGSILGCWWLATAKAEDKYTVTGGGAQGNYSWNPLEVTPGEVTIASTTFSRSRVYNPGDIISSIEDKNSLFHVDLSPTRIRTIAELIIQAKL